MNSKQILATIAMVGLATASQLLLAGTIDVTYAGSANFGSGPVGYYTGSVVPNPNSSTTLVGALIGGDSFTSTNHAYDFSITGEFDAWCVDLYHWLSGGTVTYIVGTESDLAGELSSLRPGTPNGMTRVNALNQLADGVYNSLVTKTDSAAFQLAVWAIAYGTADGAGHYHVGTTDSNFRVDSATATSAYGLLANQWLDNLGIAQNPRVYTLAYLNDGTRETTQDMIVFTQTPNLLTDNRVPEPATLALLGIGLAGLGFSRRRK